MYSVWTYAWNFPHWWYALPDAETIKRFQSDPTHIISALGVWFMEIDTILQGHPPYIQFLIEENALIGLVKEDVNSWGHPLTESDRIVDIGILSDSQLAAAFFHGLTNTLMFLGDTEGVCLKSFWDFYCELIPDVFREPAYHERKPVDDSIRRAAAITSGDGNRLAFRIDPNLYGKSPRKNQNDERDSWIYKQCCDLVPYSEIRFQLTKKTKWDQIDHDQGIRQAAIRYAKRKSFPPPPKRTD